MVPRNSFTCSPRERIFPWPLTTKTSRGTFAVFTTLQAKRCFLSGREGSNFSTHRSRPRSWSPLTEMSRLLENSRKRLPDGVRRVPWVFSVPSSSPIVRRSVYFEFCLHETVDPQKTLAHARALAPDVVVLDPSPGSDWSFYVAEEERVRRSAEAMKRFGIRRHETLHVQQHFKDYVELLAKVAEQGTVAIQRVQRFAGTTNIVIPMNCELALL